MVNFEKSVPFDPGFGPNVYDIAENVQAVAFEISKYKSPHQKKFQFSRFEPVLVNLINNNAGFYLGCILWGAYIHFRFKDNPKEISDNAYLDISDEEIININFTQNIDFIINYLPKFNKDCKYFLGKPSRVDKDLIKILENYREFVLLNNGFLRTTDTSNIKIPKDYNYLETMSSEELDLLYNKIEAVIKTGKLEDILNLL
jgi:hypothetical protein